MSSNADHLQHCIQKVATGPEYSKNLSVAEAYTAMQYILSGEADPVQAAIFLVALRMKRETDAENTGVLQAMIDASQRVVCEVDELIDIADPYNGMLRGLPVAAFAAPLLAACGLPAFTHGLEAVAPKFGITHRQVLRAAGIGVDDTPQQVANQLADPAIGWGYLDQTQACPALHALVPLRQRMVKRTLITTLEGLLKPISAKCHTHLLTGYIHKAYPTTYATLAQYAGYATAAIVRGVEGGVIASLHAPAKYYRCQQQGDARFVPLDPAALGVQHPSRVVPLPEALKPTDDTQPLDTSEAAKRAAEQGVQALQNREGIARDSLIYCAAVALHHTGKYTDLSTAAGQARRALASGAAYRHFTAHC